MLLEPLTLFLLLLYPLLTPASRPNKNAILLSEVRTLTLRGNGAKTTARRVAPIPQLKCISSKAICDLYPIDVMRCTNQGSSYGAEDVEWSCSASLPEEFKLGSTDVICEGYASPDDPYVLKGSCGVEYRLILTDKGEQRYPDVANPNGRWFSDGEGGTDLGAWAFAVVFFAVLGWILYSAWRNGGGNPGQRPPRRGGYGGGPGGGGGGGWGPGWGPGNDPPPPYPGTKPDQSQQGWRPGFWSGLAGGAAAGYMAGSRNNRRDDGYDRYASRGWGAGPSGSRSFSSGSGSNSGSNSPRYESTGFGSTRRR